MNSKNCKTALSTLALALVAVALLAAPSLAADYYMCAEPFNKIMPDTGEVVPMWGFKLDDDNNLVNGCPIGNPVMVPGPAIDVGGDTVLNIHLLNDLPPNSEPISLVITGLNASMSPTWIDPTSGTVTSTGGRLAGDTTSRVRSFNTETSPGAPPTTYSWTGITPGTRDHYRIPNWATIQ